jgi:hypothetical protein
MTAQAVVQRMAYGKHFTPEQEEFIRKFAGVLGVEGV